MVTPMELGAPRTCSAGRIASAEHHSPLSSAAIRQFRARTTNYCHASVQNRRQPASQDTNIYKWPRPAASGCLRVFSLVVEECSYLDKCRASMGARLYVILNLLLFLQKVSGLHEPQPD
eukprot:scpid45516/ scgid14871/ 